MSEIYEPIGKEQHCVQIIKNEQPDHVPVEEQCVFSPVDTISNSLLIAREETSREVENTRQAVEQTKREIENTKQQVEQRLSEIERTNQHREQTLMEVERTKHYLEQTLMEIERTKQHREQTLMEIERTKQEEFKLQYMKEEKQFELLIAIEKTKQLQIEKNIVS